MEDLFEIIVKIILLIMFVSLVIATSFIIIAFLFWLVCLGFEIEFTWLKAIGVWAGAMIIYIIK